ncbi:hypothetical protein SKAU_G00304950 [Synaphobranchus kaupii]|uniref:Cwf19-like protein C-terminal domain-containing protein n=1 Tax=Synaphobranchus kaupii TaxID=118154 RepID=A0A9Q1IJR4_SYNKA|nr:hypothetical protein SKAU_G00304950 [Synaphobranchus kaupii]
MMGKQDGDNYTLDDMFVSSAAQKERSGQDEERQRRQGPPGAPALGLLHGENAPTASTARSCPNTSSSPSEPRCTCACRDSVSLAEGHCLITPLQHHCAATRPGRGRVGRDSDVSQGPGEDRRRHLVYECVPLPRELGDMAPIYFKKALMECDEEWAMNKKVVDLSSRDIRRAIPKGLPYFSVDFGLQGGFAHVIENEKKFPHYFGKEIIGGMLDLEPRRWRKPIRENFDDQRKKVLEFAKWWKPFDCTKTDV